LIAIGAALFPTSTAPPPEKQVVAQVALLHAPRPTPLPPTPTPPPPPKPKIVAKRTIVPRKIQPAKAAHVSRVKIAATHPPELSQKSTTPTVQTGSLGTGGTGTGQSGTGTGSGGAPPADEPCGEVDFVVDGNPRYDPATQFYIYDNVSISVRLPDGSHQQIALDYPWRYKDEAGDPFQHTDQLILFEFPPVALRAAEPPLVQYVMTHSTPEGFTKLNRCPP
jgi:hypothetical protein